MIAEAVDTKVNIHSVSYCALMAEPNSVDLVRAYANECAVPDAEPQPAIYEAMQKAGSLKCFAAYAGGILVGFCSVISAVVPHDGHLVATTESLFVDPAYRHTSAFEDLFSAAEKYATESDCRILACGARVGSALDKVLSRRPGFERTHAQHTKWLGRWAGLRRTALSVPAVEQVLSAPSPAVLDRLDHASDVIRRFPQVEVVTEHLLHGGMYSRTIRRGPGVVAVGSVILRATILIVNGSCSLLDGEGQVRRLTGYNVLSGLAGRKSLSLTHSDVEMTMIFPTLAKTVEEAENEIFGEADELMSRKDGSRDVVVVTGE